MMIKKNIYNIFNNLKNRIMKQKILLFSIFLFSSMLLNAQFTVDFEDQEVGDTSFTVNGFEFKMTDDFLISEFDDFSCDGSVGPNKYMDTGYLDQASSGVLGSIAPVNPVVLFQMSVTSPQCAWPGSGDGEHVSTGVFRFTGLTADDNMIFEEIELTSDNFTDHTTFTFADTIWQGVDLKNLEMEIVSTSDSTDYFVIDNLTFETISDPTSTNNLAKTLFDISPNPTNGIIRITTLENMEVNIYNNLGALVKTALNTNQDIDLSILPAGIYFVSLLHEEGLITRKIIKQ